MFIYFLSTYSTALREQIYYKPIYIVIAVLTMDGQYHFSRIKLNPHFRERSGSVVECFTRDRRASGSSLTKVGRAKPPPVLTSGLNRLKPPRSICQKVVNTGQYESEWSIEKSKGRFCGGLGYLNRFYVLSIEKRKKILFRPCQGHFSW